MAQYKKDSTFNAPSLKGKTAEEMGRLVEQHLRDIAGKLNHEFTNLESLSPGSQTINIINATSGGSSSGGGGSSSTSNFRSGRQAITSSGTNVTFSSPTTSGYALVFRAYNGSNQTIGCDISLVTNSGFKATPLENGTIEYCALPYA